MNPLQQVIGTRHEYQFKGWQKAFYLLLSCFLIVIGIFSSALGHSAQSGPFGGLMGLFFVAIGLYLLLTALRSRLIIDGTRIEVRGAFKENSADLSQIEGFRTVSTRNGTFIQLYLKEGRGKITLSKSFKTDDDYRAWFQQIPDLDARDRDALLEEISRQQELGASPEERLATLKQAKTWNVVTIVVAVAAAIGLNFGATAFRLPAAVVLALVPVVVQRLVSQSPLLYALFARKSDPRAELSFALMISGFGFMLWIHNYHFISMQSLLMVAALVTLVYTAAFFNSVSQNQSRIGTLIGLIIFAGMYSYGLVIAADTLTDNFAPTTYSTQVTGKHTTRGKSTTYYLVLAPWGPVETTKEISVSSATYRDTQRGDTICLDLHPGRIHFPWYQIVDCPTAPSSEPAQQ